MARQSFPAHTAQDNISTLASEGTNSAFDHIIQIGLRDNILGAKGWTDGQLVCVADALPDRSDLGR